MLIIAFTWLYWVNRLSNVGKDGSYSHRSVVLNSKYPYPNDTCGRCCFIGEFPPMWGRFDLPHFAFTRFREWAIHSFRTIDRVGPSKRDFTLQSDIIVWDIWVNYAQQFTIFVPFGAAETMENDPCTVGTARNYITGTGKRQGTSAQAKKRNRQAFQRRMTQKTTRIHVAERETSHIRNNRIAIAYIYIIYFRYIRTKYRIYYGTYSLQLRQVAALFISGRPSL